VTPEAPGPPIKVTVPAVDAGRAEGKRVKGIIFNLLEEVVTAEQGADRWDELLERSGVEGAYTSVGNYDDEEFVRLLSTMRESSGASLEGLFHWFGVRAMPLLADRFPMFFEPHRTTRAFLLTLNDIIHSEVRKLYLDADVPVFDFDPTPGSRQLNGSVLTLGYRSQRRLCALAEGFIMGAAAHFHEQVQIEQPVCMLRGDERCSLVCTFEPAPTRAG
jgi:hypothetical protein